MESVTADVGGGGNPPIVEPTQFDDLLPIQDPVITRLMRYLDKKSLLALSQTSQGWFDGTREAIENRLRLKIPSTLDAKRVSSRRMYREAKIDGYQNMAHLPLSVQILKMKNIDRPVSCLHQLKHLTYLHLKDSNVDLNDYENNTIKTLSIGAFYNFDWIKQLQNAKFNALEECIFLFKEGWFTATESEYEDDYGNGDSDDEVEWAQPMVIQSITAFLEKHQSVRSVTVNISETDLLLGVLQSSPKLHTLKITDDRFTGSEYEAKLINAMKELRHLTVLDYGLRDIENLDCKRLESLETDVWDDHHHRIFEYSENMKRLKLLNAKAAWLPTISNAYTNLTSLELCLSSFYCSDVACHFPNLTTLLIGKGDRNITRGYNEKFLKITHFRAPSLKTLHFQDNILWSPEEIHHLAVNSPNLEYLLYRQLDCDGKSKLICLELLMAMLPRWKRIDFTSSNVGDVVRKYGEQNGFTFENFRNLYSQDLDAEKIVVYWNDPYPISVFIGTPTV